MKVRELMTGSAVSVHEDEPVVAAARLMKARNIGSIPVCGDDGQLTGILTDRDIVVRCVAPGADPGAVKIAAVMTPGTVTVTPADEVDTALARMTHEQVRRLPVVQDGRLVGMLSIADVARSRRCAMEAARALCGITSNVCRR